MSAIRYWVWLTTRTTDAGLYAAALAERFGSPEAVFFAEDEVLESIPELPEKLREALCDKNMRETEAILSSCERLGLRLITIQDADYPERLREIPAPPALLYVRGSLPHMDDEVAIGIVGARRASPYGIKTAGRLGLALARQGAVVVSGSARGIDSAAIRGALRGGGRVVAVLGNGVDVVYPSGAEALYEDIAVTGALVSEFPPGTEPMGRNFPQRNRILAGLTLGVTVVEALERSGSLITARWALEQNRDVFAVPGNIDAAMSAGTNALIRRGEAKLIQDVWDILVEYEALYPGKIIPRSPLPPKAEEERLEYPGEKPAAPPGKKARKKPVLIPQKDTEPEPEESAVPAEPERILDLAEKPDAVSGDERLILRSLLEQPEQVSDDLVVHTGLSARQVLTALTMLQVRALVRESEGKRFSSLVRLIEPDAAEAAVPAPEETAQDDEHE